MTHNIIINRLGCSHHAVVLFINLQFITVHLLIYSYGQMHVYIYIYIYMYIRGSFNNTYFPIN